MKRQWALALMICLMIAPACAIAQTAPLELMWKGSVPNGVDRIDFFALGGKRMPHVYAASFDEKRTKIFVFDIDGALVYDTVASRTGSQESGSETSRGVACADLDENGYLDIFLATDIRASGINNHRLYMLQRVPEAGLDRFYNRFMWMDKDSGAITDISFALVDQDIKPDIVFASVDNTIKVDNQDGERLVEIDLGANVWDVVAIPPDRNDSYEVIQNINQSDVSGVLYLAAVHDGMYLAEKGGVIWVVREGEMFNRIDHADIDGDGVNEYMGITGDDLVVVDAYGQELWTFTREGMSDMEPTMVFGANYSFTVVTAGQDLYFISPLGELTYEFHLGEELFTISEGEMDGAKVMIVGAESGVHVLSISDTPFKADTALRYYLHALEAYKAENYTLSHSLSNMSRHLFHDIKYLDNESSAKDLQGRSMSHIMAANLLAESRRMAAQGLFNESLSLSTQAMNIYVGLGYERGIEELQGEITTLQNTTQKVQDEIKKVSDIAKAEDEYNTGEEMYIRGDHGMSLSHAKRAYELYERIGDERGMSIAQKLIDMNQIELATTTTTTLYITTTTTVAEFELKTDDIILYAALLGVLLVVVTVVIPQIRNR